MKRTIVLTVMASFALVGGSVPAAAENGQMQLGYVLDYHAGMKSGQIRSDDGGTARFPREAVEEQSRADLRSNSRVQFLVRRGTATATYVGVVRHGSMGADSLCPESHADGGRGRWCGPTRPTVEPLVR